jgi:transposase
MANILGNDKREQILALGRLGWSLRRIEEATGVRRETASRYLRASGVAVRSPGWRSGPPKPAKETSSDPGQAKAAIETSTDSEAAEAEAAIEVSTDPGGPPAPGRSPQASACEPYREWIEAGVRRGRTAMAIWQDLVDDHGFASAYASVKRFVAKLREEAPRDAHPVITTAPGEEGQVDYGDGPMVRYPETRKYRRTRLFVFTLGCSRKSVRWLVWKSSSQVWSELHEKSFRRLGGAPRVVVLDNLKEGVLAPDVYDPSLNPLYRDVLAHYGVTALPCRVRHPDRKGKVESGVRHAQQKVKGMRFESLEEAQTYLDRWESRWADTRIHGTTKRQVAEMYAEEKPHLLPLPIEPFRYYQHGERTVHLDGAVEVEAAYYQAPPGWLGRRVTVQWDGMWVRLLDPRTGELLREYVRQERGKRRMREEDRPKRTPATTLQLLVRARRAGEHVGEVCETIHRQDGEPGVRRILGVLSLCKRHGIARVDGACAAALDLALPNYQFVKRYLERQPELPLSLKQVDPLIRELTHYRDLIDRRTEGDPTR